MNARLLKMMVLKKSLINELSPDDKFYYDRITCPLTQEIFSEPVINHGCGHSVEMSAAHESMDNGHTKCPVCCLHPMRRNSLTVNLILKDFVSHFLDKHPKFLPYQFFSGRHLHHLIKINEINKVMAIFKAHPDKINEPLVDGKTALHLAVEEGQRELMETLIYRFIKTIDVNAKIIKHSDVTDGRTPIYLAAREQKSHFVNLLYLLNHGADPSIPASNGATPLNAAFTKGNFLHAEILLGEAKNRAINLNINCAGGSGQVTALISAAKSKCPQDIFSELVFFDDIDINVKGKNGESALFIAAANGEADKVSILLARPEIDAEAMRSDGRTARQIARINGHKEVLELFDRYYSQTSSILSINRPS